MNNLIKIQTSLIAGENLTAVNARDLHQALGVGRDFTTWIRRRIEKYGFEVDVDFTIARNTGISLPQLGERDAQNLGRWGGDNKTDYLISLDMAKELAMVEANDKGKQVRRYFIECEKQLRRQQTRELQRLQLIENTLEKNEGHYTQADHVLNNDLPAMQARLNDMSRRLLDLENEVKVRKSQNRDKIYEHIEGRFNQSVINNLMTCLDRIEGALKDRSTDATMDRILESIREEFDKLH